MFTKIRRYKRLLTVAAVALALLATGLLLWSSIHAPERGRDPLVASMEKDSDQFFATERDMGTLARDAKSGAARGIGLSAEYALVSLADGSRYYVRIDSQRALVTELLKDQMAAASPAIFSLAEVQPPAGPLGHLSRINPNVFSVLSLLLFGYLVLMMSPMRGNGNMFKSVGRPESRFQDVVGVLEAKEALQDIVAYLKKPARFSELGAKPPRGVVLEGHFGSGKTLLARAVAGEAGVPFFSLSGSDFSDMFLGVGVRRVKSLFAQARKHAPCVVFIDEIDGLGRRSSGGSAGETENNRIINALLVELDGFKPSTGIVVLGATNNVDHLDPALVRAGRFDRTCHLGLPNVDERAALYALYAAKLRTDGASDFRQLARLSTGLSPASIANVVNRAALLAAKEDAAAVTQKHLLQVLDQHRMGGAATPGQAVLGLGERHRIAVHEAGHAIIAKLLNVGVVEKVSILQRGKALGVTLVTTEQDRVLQSEPEMRSRIGMLLGGRCAEQLVLKTPSTGAANDLEHVSGIAYRMVTEFGFCKDVGPFSYAGLPERERGGGHVQDAIGFARAIVKTMEIECARLLEANRHALDILTAQLLEHETVGGEAVDAALLVCPAGQPLVAA